MLSWIKRYCSVSGLWPVLMVPSARSRRLGGWARMWGLCYLQGLWLGNPTYCPSSEARPGPSMRTRGHPHSLQSCKPSEQIHVSSHIFLTKSNLLQGPEILKADLGKENRSTYFKTRNDSSEEASDRKEASHREQIVSSPHLGHAHSCKGGPAHWTLWTIF